jgi:hypothetical protein
MARIFSEQATVRVWRNLKKWGKVPTSHFGHAAVTISSKTAFRGKEHISFWPYDGVDSNREAITKQAGTWSKSSQRDNEKEMSDFTALRLEVGYCQAHEIPYPEEWDKLLRDGNKTAIAEPRLGQNRITMPRTNDVAKYSNGWPRWSQSAEVKIALPGIGSDDSPWGLSVRRMSKWWQRFKDSEPHYRALGKQNCAGVALMGLREGGAEAFVKCPSIMIYAEPVQVENYARQIEVELERMNTWSQELDTAIRQAQASQSVQPDKMGGAPPVKGVLDGLFSVDVWKQKSDLGTFKVRSSTIRDIDRALKDYHDANWTSKFTSRYEALVKMFQQIVAHHREKSHSGRSEAVLALGSQILTIVRNPGPHSSQRI